MSRTSTFLAFASLLVTAAISACSPSKPPDAPEAPAASADPEAAAAPSAAPSAAPAPDGETPAASPPPQKGADVDSSISLDTYEMTPADCTDLGHQYGIAARADQMSALSPKLSEKQRAATAAQVDKVVGKLEEKWINGCQTSLVNKAVDHAGIKCALSAKTVKAFDTCLNGTHEPAGKPKKK